ncbi:nucleotide sugar dehydrogenase [Streptomyces sp. NBC_01241]|uniref:UDP-glucose dehydrogenase family protein n=1 Tax=Streptomyces sp. NBC_01241 TaxID=2903794 RepID=UPI00352F03C2|nr:nucleotide sugar dehydrogenase [Streptomyces sp. NBC_01241]
MIIGKSTVTVGTSRDLGALLARLSPAGEDVEVVWNPEFLREGHAIDDTLRPDRIVVGVPSARAEDVVRQVYAPLLADGIPLFVTDPATTELIKGAANAYLGMKISFINGVADMCAVAGADVQQLTEAIGVDPRIGRGGLNAGPGYGGGCLPKDVRAFTASARALGATKAATLLRAAEEVNESHPTAALKLIEQTLGRPVDGVRVTVWGASFKAGTNDVRESPALAIASLMHQRGATVTVHDPHALPTALRRNPELDYADTLDASVQGAEVIVLATEWPHFREADSKALASLVAAPVLVDLRNLIDADAWRMAGCTVRQLGRPRCGPHPPSRLPEPGRADRLCALRAAARCPATAVERALHRNPVQRPPRHADPRAGPVRPREPATVPGGDRMRYVGRGGHPAPAPAPRDLPGHRPPGPRAAGAPLHPLPDSGHTPP